MKLLLENDILIFLLNDFQSPESQSADGQTGFQVPTASRINFKVQSINAIVSKHFCKIR